MSKFRKRTRRKMIAINTSSLPDIVFMLLFFFMVATTSKEANPTVKIALPIGNQSNDLTPYKQRSEIDFIYIGEPIIISKSINFKYGFALSLDNVVYSSPDQLYHDNDVAKWKTDKFNSKPTRMKAPIDRVITCIKADKKTPAGLIFDIRKQLQNINALTIAYAVDDKGN